MSSLVAALALAALVPNALAQSGVEVTPLASKRFDYTALVRRRSPYPSPSPLAPSLTFSPPSSPTRPTLALVNVVHNMATTSATRLSVLISEPSEASSCLSLYLAFPPFFRPPAKILSARPPSSTVSMTFASGAHPHPTPRSVSSRARSVSTSITHHPLIPSPN